MTGVIFLLCNTSTIGIFIDLGTQIDLANLGLVLEACLGLCLLLCIELDLTCPALPQYEQEEEVL